MPMRPAFDADGVDRLVDHAAVVESADFTCRRRCRHRSTRVGFDRSSGSSRDVLSSRSAPLSSKGSESRSASVLRLGDLVASCTTLHGGRRTASEPTIESICRHRRGHASPMPIEAIWSMACSRRTTSRSPCRVAGSDRSLSVTRMVIVGMFELARRHRPQSRPRLEPMRRVGRDRRATSRGLGSLGPGHEVRVTSAGADVMVDDGCRRADRQRSATLLVGASKSAVWSSSRPVLATLVTS